ncbi:MAG: RNase H family protein, partial [Candidatus Gracilibacteria bacterium]
TLFSDSNLLISTINHNWKKKANKDLWEKIDALRAWLNIKWVWVKGHASNKYNNMADELAQKEAGKFKKSISSCP